MNIDRNVTRAAQLDTASLSDALDKCAIPGQCLGVKPLLPSFKLAGRAFTVRYCAIDPVNPGTVGDYIDDVPPGAVVVLDNGGRADATVWGDILTMVASQSGLAGTVIEGACRDVSLAMEINYPMFVRHSTMRTGKDRVQVDEVNGGVSVGAIRVNAGDLIVGDADGVLCIPAAVEEKILAIAEEIQAAEQRIRDDVKAGSTLKDARSANRYHQLQTKA
ncbi:RraA family protein [Ensifer sp. YR511]|uniref:RraA family protein n=1 Tax=Ensifer sp. YR511 TaxID=1855294 RepID=UPI000883FFB3|nr:diguanylate cyclase [Ensifer sp. YR511]SDN42611.1 Regulator of RNase E activity RraA [Ensifer sp. YR511]